MTEADKALSVLFFMHTKENPRRSKEEGRPIFEEIEMVSVQAPGDSKRVMTARAHDMHYDSNTSQQWTYAERFAEHYDAFRRGVENQAPGTPLEEVPFLSLSQKAEMRAMKITTVEQLAGMADRDVRSKGMGFRAHVDAAKAYLDTATGTANLSKEMAALRARIAELEKPEPKAEANPFDVMEEEDLRLMLTDAGVAVDGRWGKARLVSEANKLAREAA